MSDALERFARYVCVLWEWVKGNEVIDGDENNEISGSQKAVCLVG